MKTYKQGDQCVFDSNTEEYKNIQEFCNLLNKNSPNQHKYKVRNIYFDFGLDWMWTTIVNETINCQVLTPRDWIHVVNKDVPYSDLLNMYFNDRFCLDKP